MECALKYKYLFKGKYAVIKKNIKELCNKGSWALVLEAALDISLLSLEAYRIKTNASNFK